MIKYIDTNKEREWLVALDGHTPGPWGREKSNNFDGWHIGSGGLDSWSEGFGEFLEWHICETTGMYDAAEQDANLIAAAPDLKAKYAAALNALTAALDEIERLREALQSLLDTVSDLDISEGVCCCGDSVESHGLHSGHSPVDAGDYYRGQVIDQARVALNPEGEE